MFEEFLPRFGVSHAKVYRTLMYGEAKTAKQICDETGVSYHKVYSILKDLAEQDVVSCINTSPANFLIKDSQKMFDKLVSKKVGQLEKMNKEFEKVINDDSTSVFEKEYLIKITEKQTKLFDNKNKAPIKEAKETKILIDKLNSYKANLEPKNQYAYAAYKGR